MGDSTPTAKKLKNRYHTPEAQLSESLMVGISKLDKFKTDKKQASGANGFDEQVWQKKWIADNEDYWKNRIDSDLLSSFEALKVAASTGPPAKRQRVAGVGVGEVN